jgi:hypothetical protein
LVPKRVALMVVETAVPMVVKKAALKAALMVEL